ncbi:VOC family protein [Streptomyces sp. NPDC127098]|uniref:VOC family protein n=1 Tax=Streptomyces sp. NPDC127098 TaxID=3347137 RepID=UPI0036674680
MSNPPVVISLPIADRRTSHRFYRDGLGLAPVGEPADDGVPEPLRFALNPGAHLILIPTGGFGWVIGGREVAERGHSECVLTVHAGSAAAVDDLVERARRAGAGIVTDPGHQPWGYAGTFADPDGHVWMVTAGEHPFD